MNRDLLYILHELILLDEGQTLNVSIMSNADDICKPRVQVGMISMRKEYNETYRDHIRAYYSDVTDMWCKRTTNDHVWSSFEVHAVMSMESTYRKSCEHTRFEIYDIEEE